MQRPLSTAPQPHLMANASHVVTEQGALRGGRETTTPPMVLASCLDPNKPLRARMRQSLSRQPPPPWPATRLPGHLSLPASEMLIHPGRRDRKAGWGRPALSKESCPTPPSQVEAGQVSSHQELRGRLASCPTTWLRGSWGPPPPDYMRHTEHLLKGQCSLSTKQTSNSHARDPLGENAPPCKPRCFPLLCQGQASLHPRLSPGATPRLAGLAGSAMRCSLCREFQPVCEQTPLPDAAWI